MTTSKMRYFWAIQVPLLSLICVAIWLTAPLWATSQASQIEKIHTLGLQSKWNQFFPKPLDTARFTALITLPTVTAILSSTFLWPQLGSKLEIWLSTPRAKFIAIVSQIGILTFLLGNLVYQNHEIHAYFEHRVILRLPLVSVLLWKAIQWVQKRKSPPRPQTWLDLALGLSVVAYVCIGLLPSLAMDGVQAITENSGHLTFFMDEYAAVLNGRVPRFDYYPMYVTLLPYLTAPLFRLTGFSVFSFTFFMACFSALGLLCMYRTFRLISTSRSQALFLYAAFLGISFLGLREYPSGNPPLFQKFYMFSYFGMSPARYLGAWLTCFFTARYLSLPSKNRLIWLGTVSGLVAVNNCDYGLPAMVAAGTVVFFQSWNSSKRQALLNTCTFLSLSFGVMLTCYILACIKSGETAGLARMFQFELGGMLGLYSIPTPTWGLHWVLFATFLASIAIGSREVANSSRAEVDSGILLFIGILGLGSMTRFATRSHWEVLHSVLPLWSIPVLILFRRTFLGSKEERQRPLLIKLSLLVPVAAFFIFLTEIPSVPNYIQRLRLPKQPEIPTVQELASTVSSQSTPGEKVFVIYKNAQWIGHLAGVDNRFPYCQDHCVTFKNQIEIIREILEKQQIVHLYGEVESEMSKLFEESGYRREHSKFAQFDVWKRN